MMSYDRLHNNYEKIVNKLYSSYISSINNDLVILLSHNSFITTHK